MKTKFKDFLLYSLACVGAVSLFLSAYQPQETTSTVPESHVWEMHSTSTTTTSHVYSFNKVTGEVRKYHHSLLSVDKNGEMEGDGNKYAVMVEAQNKS